MKRNSKKGFTIAELLIVVAIIAVLVAVAIPVFSTQLKHARVGTAVANVRSAYSEAEVRRMTNDYDQYLYGAYVIYVDDVAIPVPDTELEDVETVFLDRSGITGMDITWGSLPTDTNLRTLVFAYSAGNSFDDCAIEPNGTRNE